jgi:hypothetical protein
MNRIFREKQTDNFTILPNAIFKTGLSLKAIGLLTYILHLPPDWVIVKTQLYKVMEKDGRQSIDSAWKELADAGFIKTKKQYGTKGNLPIISYYVYDSPQKGADCQHAGFQHAESTHAGFTQPESSVPKTDQLLSTDEKSTIVQSIPVIPDGITGPPLTDSRPAKPKKEKKAKPAPAEKEIGIFQRFTASYDDFFKKLNGVPAQYGKASGAATNSLVAYFRKIAKDRATKDAVNDPGETYIDEKAHEGWVYVLNNWARLDGFLQTKTRLIDINSNIQNIITQLKNGHSKKQTGNSGPTGGNVSTASLAHTIAAVYGSTGQR